MASSISASSLAPDLLNKTHKSFNKAISASLHNHLTLNPLTPDQICNSPYCQPYNSYNVNSENFVLYQLIIPN